MSSEPNEHQYTPNASCGFEYANVVVFDLMWVIYTVEATIQSEERS